MDICKQDAWLSLLELVEREGKFDYAICTHTLEDVYSPVVALEMMPRIAKAGIISMPSLWAELNHVESTQWLGFMHHRWIFDFDKEGNMLLLPKLGFLSSLWPNGIGNFSDHNSDIFYQ